MSAYPMTTLKVCLVFSFEYYSQFFEVEMNLLILIGEKVLAKVSTCRRKVESGNNLTQR